MKALRGMGQTRAARTTPVWIRSVKSLCILHGGMRPHKMHSQKV